MSNATAARVRPPTTMPLPVNVPGPSVHHVERNTLHELEAAVRLVEDMQSVLEVYAISEQFRERVRARIAAIRITLRREWNRRSGGKQP